MILDGQIVGRPLISYKDTKTAIEALTGVVAGMTAYATDANLTGYYTGASWVWGVGSSGSTILALPQYHFFVGGSSGSAEDAGTGITYNPATNRLSLDNVQWDLTPTPVSPAEGLMYWNSDDGTLNLGMPGGDVNLQLGQEMLLRAKNETGLPITNGQLVYISGGTGSNAIVSLAQANSELSSAATIGMATETIADSQFGYITLSGMVRDINTSGSAAGTVLYLSPTVAGAYTGNKPVAPNHLVSIGVIIRSHATEGVVFVRVDNGFEISELHDVLITNPATNQVLQYNSSGSYWQNSVNTLSIAGNSTINGSLVGNMTGGGTVATGGFTLTAPASITVLGRDANIAAGRVAFGSDANTVTGEDALFWDAANNRLGIGTATPGYAIDAIAAGSGAIRLSENATNATTKFGRFVTRHYTNAEEDFIGFNVTSTSAAGIVQFGGGSGIFNTATLIQFYTAANNTTLTGTERMSIDSAGYGRFLGDYTANRVGVGSIFTQASPATIATPLHVSVATAGSWQAVTIQNGNSATNDTADIDFRMTSAALTTGRIGAARVGASAITDLVFHTYNGSLQERMRIDNVGLTTIKANNATTGAVDAVLTLGHNSTGTAAALFGLRTNYTLESSTTADQVAGYEDRLWTDATHATRTTLYRGATTGNATQTGFYGAWAHNAIANTAITIIPNGTGDVASVGTFVFTVKDNTSATTNGGVVVLNPNGGAISLLSDGTDTLQITCAADGSVTIARSAGTHTFTVSIWGTWQ